MEEYKDSVINRRHISAAVDALTTGSQDSSQDPVRSLLYVQGQRRS